MFISYQNVRNAMLGTLGAAVAGVAAFFGFQNPDTSELKPSPSKTVQLADLPAPQDKPKSVASPAKSQVNASKSPGSGAPRPTSTTPNQSPNQGRPITTADQYRHAMTFATAKADSSGKGKDVLGQSSPWKLNLYDDNKDGQWDRGKLDTNRDELDDEKWNFKNGSWEKDGGKTVWSGNNWRQKAEAAPNELLGANPVANQPQSTSDHLQDRYRKAMKIATQAADPSGKGKDVLGPSSPWKLNLYDDDKDGKWDRGKLDTNRDEIDDEKWNFKRGRWEKDGGATEWKDDRWIPSKT